ncbi:MAG: hypothetical protein E7491_07780 [Ruminococcaceae bacterium]|nr:hypothetical protein [Oscillospiraceae bacterium]
MYYNYSIFFFILSRVFSFSSHFLQYFNFLGGLIYSVNGDFGQVRLSSAPSTCNGLFTLESVGRHKCNDKYSIFRPDGHHIALIIYTVGGRGLLQIEDTEYNLTPDTVAFIPVNVKNSYKTPPYGLWEFYWLHPQSEMCDKFMENITQSNIYVKKASPRYITIILIHWLKNLYPRFRIYQQRIL